MPLPTIVFGVLLSTLYGALFHLIRGGTTRIMLVFILLAWIGFWLGDTLGWAMGWNFAAVGTLNAGMASILSVLFLLLGEGVRWLRNAVHAS